MGYFKVPVIAIFTKFDQFKRNMQMNLEDEGRAKETSLNNEVEAMFHEHYKASVEEASFIIRLESEGFLSSSNSYCANLPYRNAYARPKVHFSYRND